MKEKISTVTLPVRLCEQALGCTFTETQGQMFLRLWNGERDVHAYGRQCGKTFVLIAYALFKAALYRDTQVGMFAPTVRMLTVHWKKMRDWFPNLNMAIVTGPGTAKTSLDNGSYIEVVPIDASSVCSRRFHIILIDESQSIPEEKQKMVIRPHQNIRPYQCQPSEWHRIIDMKGNG